MNKENGTDTKRSNQLSFFFEAAPETTLTQSAKIFHFANYDYKNDDCQKTSSALSKLRQHASSLSW